MTVFGQCFACLNGHHHSCVRKLSGYCECRDERCDKKKSEADR